MIADDLVIAKIPSFSTVMAFDGRNLLQEHVRDSGIFGFLVKNWED